MAEQQDSSALVFDDVSKKEEVRVGDVLPLSILPIGTLGNIELVEGEGRVRRRLFDMGLTPGAEVYLRKKAPLGDPLEVTLRGYELTLRKEEAKEVLLKVTNLPEKATASDKEKEFVRSERGEI